MGEKQLYLFLDSGAYSAKSKGVEIDIYKYIEFIKEYKSDITVYANLDVIGDAEATLKNQKIMESEGLTPLPCFHRGEDWKYLDYYVANYDYIALGGVAQRKDKNHYTAWLNRCWDIICDTPDGMPKVRVHGFGITSLDVMMKYPWYCMTEKDHTVLTKTGWKGLSSLSVGEEILCFNNGTSEWQEIEKIPIFDVKNEKINHLWNRNFEAFVTDNHRWIVSNRNKKNKDVKWKFRTTKELKAGDCINRVGIGIPNDNVFLNIPVYTDEQIGLLAWFWIDGTIKKQKKCKNDSVVIYQSKRANSNKCEIIRDLLIKSGEQYCESKEDKSGIIQFELYGDISKWLLSFAPNKILPDFLPFRLTRKQAELFLDYSILADGCRTGLTRKKGFSIVVNRQVKKNNLDVVRNICLLLGIPTSIYGENKKHKGLLSSSVYHVYVKELKQEEQIYSGKLWCVQVPSGAFFTKCKDKIYVTGNSVDSTSWVLTGRGGAIYVPRFRGGKYVYDQNTWKIFVSAQNPAKSKPGEHFETLSLSDRQIVLDYIKSKGFSIGKSEIKAVDRYYKLRENEKWYKVNERNEDKICVDDLTIIETDEYGRRFVEVVIEPGLCNDYRQRDAINIMYFLDVEKNFRPWPWPYKRKGLEGFGLRGGE